MSKFFAFGTVVMAIVEYLPNLSAEVPCPIRDQPELSVELSQGDFVDKIIILQIKMERFTDPAKLFNVKNEYAALQTIFEQHINRSEEFDELYNRLLIANKKLWGLEDLTRIKERDKQFDDQFARYVLDIIDTNDERARIKHDLNLLLGSQIIEEKSYVDLLQTVSFRNANAPLINTISIPAPLADIADRITILEIKAEQIKDPEKMEHINQELSLLRSKFYSRIPACPEMEELTAELRAANQEMWDIQDALRAKRRRNEIDTAFIELGRGVYHANDKRVAIKRRLNQLLGSKLVEEKCYAA